MTTLSAPIQLGIHAAAQKLPPPNNGGSHATDFLKVISMNVKLHVSVNGVSKNFNVPKIGFTAFNGDGKGLSQDLDGFSVVVNGKELGKFVGTTCLIDALPCYNGFQINNREGDAVEIHWAPEVSNYPGMTS